MEKRILKSMVDYVLEYTQKSNSGYEAGFKALEGLTKIKKYAKFLSMPLTLGMFIPTDEDGNVLPESDKFRSCGKGLEYGKALDNVIFEGFEVREEYNELIHLKTNYSYTVIYDKNIKRVYIIGFDKVKTIEDILKFEFELTQSAITKYQI